MQLTAHAGRSSVYCGVVRNLAMRPLIPASSIQRIAKGMSEFPKQLEEIDRQHAAIDAIGRMQHVVVASAHPNITPCGAHHRSRDLILWVDMATNSRRTQDIVGTRK